MDPSQQPILYYDLGSPYAYLAAERAADALGIAPRMQPILVGGIFAERGFGSWAKTSQREQGIAEVEARAERYGLPPLRWPEGWPNNTLKAMRAATWATTRGEGQRFALAAFRHAFVAGADLSQLEEVVRVAESVDLPVDELEQAIASGEVKAALREATADAWARGVTGVPCVEAAGEIFYGDDRLWAARESIENHSARA